MATSEVSISNMALSWLGGNLIISLDDESDEAAACKANYSICRDAVLEDRDWTFATQTCILSPQVGEPVGSGYAYQFTVPAELIRIIAVSDEPKYVHDLQWEIQGNTIVCDSSILYLKFIKRIEDPIRFTAGFVHALAARLAVEIALTITNSPDMQNQMTALYATKLERAGAMDGMQGKNVPLRSNRLLKVR